MGNLRDRSFRPPNIGLGSAGYQAAHETLRSEHQAAESAARSAVHTLQHLEANLPLLVDEALIGLIDPTPGASPAPNRAGDASAGTLPHHPSFPSPYSTSMPPRVPGPSTSWAFSGQQADVVPAIPAVDVVAQNCSQKLLAPLRKLQKLRAYFTEVGSTTCWGGSEAGLG